ncbi:MAG: flagellar hook-basal body complex protein FliE [bacterium]|jgi:flagellar hook-basal body complex protein FliE
MSGMKVNGIDPSTRIFKMPEELPKPRPRGGEQGSFGGMVKDVIKDAVQADHEATAAINDFALGNIQDVHDVVLAVNKANMAIGLLVEVRNGLINAYNELSKISM